MARARFITVLTYSQSNVHADATGRARITDFGLAAVTKYSVHQDHSVRWTVPEVSSKQAMYSKKADVFSFAINKSGGRLPRPAIPALTDRLWPLTQRCWNPEAPRRPQVSEVLQVLRDGYANRSPGYRGLPAWKRLVTGPLTAHERTSLITTIFSDRDEIEVVSQLCGDDARSFIDVIDEVPPYILYVRMGSLTFTSR